MMNRCETSRWMRAVVMVLCVTATLGWVDVAAADDDKAPSYDVTIWAIRATKSNSDVSSELKPIVRELKKQFNYTGYKLERKKSGATKQGSTISADLIGGFKAKVTPVSQADKRVTLKIEITRTVDKKEKRLIGTTVTIERAKFQLLGGWKIEAKSDDVLIVAVSAR